MNTNTAESIIERLESAMTSAKAPPDFRRLATSATLEIRAAQGRRNQRVVTGEDWDALPKAVESAERLLSSWRGYY